MLALKNIEEVNNKVRVIRQRLKVEQDRQNAYYDFNLNTKNWSFK